VPRVTSHKTKQALLETGAVIDNPEDLPERLQIYDADGNPLNIPRGARRNVIIVTEELSASEDTGKLATREPGGGESGTTDFEAMGVMLTHILVSRPCRVRLYTTPAKRTADIDRDRFTDPMDRLGPGTVPDHGCLCEFLLLSMLDLDSIPADYLQMGIGSTNLYYRIDNFDLVAGPVTVTLTVKDVEQ
jgi:hypothetical protein